MSINSLGRSEVRDLIERRMEEFEKLGRNGKTTFNFRPFLNLKIKATIVTELAFCISTANSSALAGLKFQKSLEGLDLHDLSVEDIEKLMRNAGVRFAKRKAKYLKLALERFEIVDRSLSFEDFQARNVLLSVKGFGMKESSHFLRNVGRKDIAILDRHVLRWLEHKGYNFKPRDYLKAEEVLRRIARDNGLSLAELDLIIWFEINGKVLK